MRYAGMSDLFSLKTIRNGMFYCGALRLPGPNPGFRIGAGPVQGFERRTEQLGRSQANYFDILWNFGAKRRNHADAANQNSRHSARRGGKNIDDQRFGG